MPQDTVPPLPASRYFSARLHDLLIDQRTSSQWMVLRVRTWTAILLQKGDNAICPRAPTLPVDSGDLSHLQTNNFNSWRHLPSIAPSTICTPSWNLEFLLYLHASIPFFSLVLLFFVQQILLKISLFTHNAIPKTIMCSLWPIGIFKIAHTSMCTCSPHW